MESINRTTANKSYNQWRVMSKYKVLSSKVRLVTGDGHCKKTSPFQKLNAINQMTTLEQIRKVALDLPAVTESLHFRLPTFKVGDKGFITVQKGAAIMSLPMDFSEALLKSDPETYELVYRNKKYFVGLKVDLGRVSISDVRPLLLEAYEHRRAHK